MSQANIDWHWAVWIGCGITIISSAALVLTFTADVSSPIQRLSSEVSYLSFPGALCGVMLAVLATGNYGSHGAFIVTTAAAINLPLYTLLILGVIRLLRAVRKRIS